MRQSRTVPPRAEPGQRLLSSTSIPVLTDKITRLDNQCCAGGGFGDVFRCRYASDDGIKEVAVKAFRFNFSVDDNERDEGKTARMIRRELGIWRRLSHRNIVPFLGITYGFGIQGNVSLVSMWMPHGTLHTFLKEHDDLLVVAHRLQLLLDIANGLQYLHSFPMVHGDLTSNNVLLDHSYNACLSDFGCASLVGELPEGITNLKMTTVKPGTVRWAAPEHFSEEEETEHTIKSDIYSFGNMALLVLSGKYPWSEVRNDVAVMLRLSLGRKPCRPLARPIDDQHWALIKRCWSSIQERPLAEDVVFSLQQFLSAADVPRQMGLAAVMSQKSLLGSDPSHGQSRLTGGPTDEVGTLSTQDIGYNLDFRNADTPLYNHLQRRYYACGWVTGNAICASLVQRPNFPEHLRLYHGVVGSDKTQVVCRWVNCSAKMKKESLARHVNEKHLELSHRCPYCHEQFTRPYTMQSHVQRKHLGN